MKREQPNYQEREQGEHHVNDRLRAAIERWTAIKTVAKKVNAVESPGGGQD